MRSALETSHLYPDDDAAELKRKLATVHGIRPEQVLVGAGSSELIAMIARTLLAPGLNAVTSEQSFVVYRLATNAARGKLIQIAMVDNGFDLEAIAKAITPATRIVFLANPNNPTGTVFDADRMDKFLAQVPEEVVVVLDEAYYEYADHLAKKRGFRYSHSVDYIRGSKNVVVLRTFSKVHGLAALRIGYAMGSPDLLARLAQARSTYSISAVAQAGALAALDDDKHIQMAVRNNASEAKRLTEELSKLGYHPVPTWANFIYCHVGEDAEGFATRLRDAGVLIRPLGPWGAPSSIRITIGTPEQNDRLLDALTRTGGTKA